MNAEKIEEMLIQSTADLKEAKRELYEASERVIVARAGLDAAKVTAVKMGVINGPNDKVRAAQEAEYCAEVLEALRCCEANERRARFVVEQFQAAYDLASKLLRIAELIGATVTDGEAPF